MWDARQLYTALMKKPHRRAQSGPERRQPYSGSRFRQGEDAAGSKTLAEFTCDSDGGCPTAAPDLLSSAVDDEIQRVIQILSRRTKNNPCLMVNPAWARLPSPRAWPGRSPWAIKPENLLDKKLLSLDLSGMVAGTKYRGEF